MCNNIDMLFRLHFTFYGWYDISNAVTTPIRRSYIASLFTKQVNKNG
jgi:hypothetical protein